MKTVLSQEIVQFQHPESVRRNNSSAGTGEHSSTSDESDDNHRGRPDETMSDPEENGEVLRQDEPESSTDYDYTNSVGGTPMSLVELISAGLSNPRPSGGGEELGFPEVYPAPNAVRYLADMLDQAVEVAGFFDENF